MSLNCLNNIIGIDNICTPEVPISGLYINKLPGISIAAMDAASDQEIKNAKQLFDDKLDLAKEIIRNQITTHFNSKVVHRSLLEHETLGYWQHNLQAVAKEASKFKGIHLEIDKSAYTELYIHSITLQLKDAVTIDAEIWDIISGTKLDTIEITTVADTPTTVQVNKAYKSDKQKLSLVVVIDSGISDTYKTTLLDGNNQCTDCGSGYGYRNHVLRARGIEISSASAKILTNVKSSSSSTNGMSLTYSVKCCIDNFICHYNNTLALPLLYLVGSLIMDEMKSSKRFNTLVTVHKTNNQELQEEYEFKYREALDNLLANMVLPENDCCFMCGSKIRQVQRIP